MSHMDSCFLHMFLNERFFTILPNLVEFLVVVMDSKGMRPSNIYKPRAWRYLNTKQASNKLLAKVIKQNALYFRPYS